jgi:tRNA (guanine-N7-)-methyltransferase
VRRGRRLPLETLQPYLLETRDIAPGPLRWRDVFGNHQPVEVEVGCGKGSFLLATAQAHPDVNFLGIEIERAFQLYAANRVAKREMKNVRLACTDARTFFRDFVANQSLQAIHVYFPDPWWKTRHRKRRLFTAEFAADCARALVEGGTLQVASDVAEYFAEIERLLATQDRLRKLPLPASEEPDVDYLTNFERKYRKEGRAIFRGAYERCDAGQSSVTE